MQCDRPRFSWLSVKKISADAFAFINGTWTNAGQHVELCSFVLWVQMPLQKLGLDLLLYDTQSSVRCLLNCVGMGEVGVGVGARAALIDPSLMAPNTD